MRAGCTGVHCFGEGGVENLEREKGGSRGTSRRKRVANPCSRTKLLGNCGCVVHKVGFGKGLADLGGAVRLKGAVIGGFLRHTATNIADGILAPASR